MQNKAVRILLIAVLIVAAGFFIRWSLSTCRLKLVKGKHFTNSAGMKMIALSDGYWVSQFETTQEQFRAIMGYDPSSDQGAGKPVERVTVCEAEEFCLRLSEYERLRGNLPEGFIYTLPSFSEWIRYVADASLDGAVVPGYYKKWVCSTEPVGSGEVNRLGLCDLRGNVSELSRDKWQKGFNYILGASWSEHRKEYLRIHNKAYFSSESASSCDVGFRCVLIKDGGSSNAGNSPLHEAVIQNAAVEIERLVKAGGAIDHTNIWGETPLHTAVMFDNLKAAEKLLQAGADVNMLTKDNAGCLHYASMRGNPEMLRLLHRYGLKINDSAFRGMGPLVIAEENASAEFVKLLIEYGAKDVVPYRKDGIALHLAIDKDRFDIAAALLEGEVDLSVKAWYDMTPLHRAALKGYAEITRKIVEKGADLNTLTENGGTALHLAAYKGNYRVAKVLVDAGIDKKIQNVQGLMAIDIASREGFKKIVELLSEK